MAEGVETKKILVVDDEADIVELVSYNLKKEGFTVDPALNGEEALKCMKSETYDLMIIDLMLPGIQGMELCRIVRRNSNTAHVPIIILTAKGEEVDKVLGLELGADDYVTKPFSPRELVARVNAVLRRSLTAKKDEGSTAEKILRIAGLEIDRERYTVSLEGRPVKLSATEFKLLLFLAERRGKVFSREQLLDAVWREESFVEPRTVDVHIRRIRAQIESDPSNPIYIKTMRGIGYFINGE
jgi:phosphate regulon transcriptional regulator PhoB